MDAITDPSAPAARRYGLRGFSLVLAVGLLTSCGGSDDDPGASVSAVSGSAASASSDAATSDDEASEDASSDDDMAEAAVIVISGFDYQVPDSVAPGAELTIRNEDSVGHTVTSDDESTFDVAVGPGQEVTFTVPDKAGEYPFHCRPHPNMKATLVVEEG